MPHKILLCILDGWGVRPDKSATDPTAKATYISELMRRNPHTYLRASGEAVGLPAGQIGNSEVGHTTIGLGRIIKQDLGRIDDAIADGSLLQKPAFQQFLAERKGGACHIAGLLSNGGVHSHVRHIQAVANACASADIPTYIHAILDGRDTPPQSGLEFVQKFEEGLAEGARIVSLCGRFFAMDRDQRWERTAAAYALIANQKAERCSPSCTTAISSAYAEGITDEFIPPICVGEPYPAEANDGIFICNFRADRARQIVQSLGDPAFSAFEREVFPRFAAIYSLTEYDATFQSFCQPLFTKEPVTNALGAVISAHNQPQVRIAETEKYAHVTFFFNGGAEEPLPGEERVFVASPKVKTYDQSPEMSAAEVTQCAIDHLKKGAAQLIVLNYANTDMLGHTGNLTATEAAVGCVDRCVQELIKAAENAGYITVLTADHGNAEEMVNADGSPNTAHTTNVVPLALVGQLAEGLQLAEYGEKPNDTPHGLKDIAPTLLAILGLDQPPEMTGISLLRRE